MDPKAFIAAVERAWRERATTPDGKCLTRLHVHVAAKLAFWRKPAARHRELARAARCSTRTVRRALGRLHALGLLSWTRRVLATRGWRAQIANLYHLNSSSSLGYQRLKSAANLSPPGAPIGKREASGAPDMLAARRAAIERLGWGLFRRAADVAG